MPPQVWAVPPPPPAGIPQQRPPAQAPRQPVAWQASPPPAVVRGKVDDPPPDPRATSSLTAAPAPRPAPLSLPAPEQLGVGVGAARTEPQRAAVVDWNVASAELRRLGALGWQMGKLPQGGYRFSFLLPTERQDLTRHIEAVGATEADAIHLALASARK